MDQECGWLTSAVTQFAGLLYSQMMAIASRRKVLSSTRIALLFALLAHSWITSAANTDGPFNFEAGWMTVPIDGRDFRLGGAHLSSEWSRAISARGDPSRHARQHSRRTQGKNPASAPRRRGSRTRDISWWSRRDQDSVNRMVRTSSPRDRAPTAIMCVMDAGPRLSNRRSSGRHRDCPVSIRRGLSSSASRAGGFGAIALGDAPPSGVVGIISFAGGRGGRRS